MEEAEPPLLDQQQAAGKPLSPPRPTLWRRFGVQVTVGVVIYVIVGAILIAKVPDRLLAGWFPSLAEDERAAFLGPAANVVLFALGGTIALVGVGLSLSRHRQELDAAERDRQRLIDDREREQARREEVEAQRRIDTERTLRERFVTTVTLLSDPSPVNRQAALFALGALADDWDVFGRPDEVQVCIEVLTGYLRVPRTENMLIPLTQEQEQLEPTEQLDVRRTTPQEIAVKLAGYAVLHEHLRPGRSTWSDRSINLGGAYVDFHVELSEARIMQGGRLSFAGAKIVGGGRVSLTHVIVADGGLVSFDRATLCEDAVVSFWGGTISQGGIVGFFEATVGDHAYIDFERSRITGGSHVTFMDTKFAGSSSVSFVDVALDDQSVVMLPAASFGDDAAYIGPESVLHSRTRVRSSK